MSYDHWKTTDWEAELIGLDGQCQRCGRYCEPDELDCIGLCGPCEEQLEEERKQR